MKNMLRMLLLFSLVAIFAIGFIGCSGKSTGKVSFTGSNNLKATLTFNMQLGEKVADVADAYNAKGQFQYKNGIQYSGKVENCRIDEVNGVYTLTGVINNGLYFTAALHDSNKDKRPDQDDWIEVNTGDGYFNAGYVDGGSMNY